MNRITNAVLSFFELVEAEGRELRFAITEPDLAAIKSSFFTVEEAYPKIFSLLLTITAFLSLVDCA